MYDAPKVIAGLAIFLGLATLPFWINPGQGNPLPKPVVKEGLTQCVEPVEYMRANHMKLLLQWRDEVVREGKRTYVSSSGRIFDKSLTKTCLDCHSNKEQFCEQCHKQVAVTPYCWECHLVPGSQTASQPSDYPIPEGQTPDRSTLDRLTALSLNQTAVGNTSPLK